MAIVSVGGVGCLPWLPGTAGTLVGTAVAVLTETTPAWQWGLLAVSLAVGLWFIPLALQRLNASDPREIVLDEFAGALLVFAGLPLTPAVVLVGFAAFRFFDVLKPLGIRRLERLPGAWGVLADDLAAALLARLAACLMI